MGHAGVGWIMQGWGGVGHERGVGLCRVGWDIQGWCGLCRGRMSGSCMDRGGLCRAGVGGVM